MSKQRNQNISFTMKLTSTKFMAIFVGVFIAVIAIVTSIAIRGGSDELEQEDLQEVNVLDNLSIEISVKQTGEAEFTNITSYLQNFFQIISVAFDGCSNRQTPANLNELGETLLVRPDYYVFSSNSMTGKSLPFEKGKYQPTAGYILNDVKTLHHALKVNGHWYLDIKRSFSFLSNALVLSFSIGPELKLNTFTIDAMIVVDLTGSPFDVSYNRWRFKIVNNEFIPAEDIRKDLHFPINVGQQFDLIETLNNSIAIDFVNRDNLSFRYLFDNAYATITPLNTPNLDIPFTLGTFKFNVLITCPFGNTADINVSVHTFDREAPIIQIGERVSVTNDRLFTREELFTKANFQTSDNYDPNSELFLDIITDTYSPNFNRGGVWQIMFSITDRSGNYSIATLEVLVHDVTAPVLQGVENELLRNIDNNLSINDILSFLTAYDETDGDITNRIRVSQDNFTGNEREAGSFLVEFYVTDLTGNRTYLSFYITNQSDVPPTINIIDGSIFVVPRGTEVSDQDLIDLLDFLNLINVENYEEFAIQSDFRGVYNGFGVYDKIITLTCVDGNITQVNVQLRFAGYSITENGMIITSVGFVLIGAMLLISGALIKKRG